MRECDEIHIGRNQKSTLFFDEGKNSNYHRVEELSRTKPVDDPKDVTDFVSEL